MILGLQAADPGFYDDAALVAALASLLTAAGGFYVVIRRQRRHADKLDQVYDHVNNVEANEDLDGLDGPPTTLGQAVSQLRAVTEEGFTKLKTEHRLFQSMLEAIGTLARSNEHRIDVHREELDELDHRVDGLEAKTRDTPPG